MSTLPPPNCATPAAPPFALLPGPAFSRPSRLRFAGEKRSASVIRSPSPLLYPFLFLSLSHSHTHTFLALSLSRLLYIVHLRIGSLSTRKPPPSPLPYEPIVVFSDPSLPPSLPPSPPPSPLLLETLHHTTTTPIPSVPSEQRERVTIYSGDLRDQEARRPPCPRAAKPPPLPLALSRSTILSFFLEKKRERE